VLAVIRFYLFIFFAISDVMLTFDVASHWLARSRDTCNAKWCSTYF